MTDLDARLARGPLRVRSIWSARSPEHAARTILRRQRFLLALDAVAFCGCVALGLALLGSGPRSLSGPSARVASSAAVGGDATGGAAPSPVTTFSDGSIAEMSSGESRLRIDQETPRRVVTTLTGAARFKVVHNPERTFEVHAGDVRVRVLGTTFSVEQLPFGQTQVLVEHGRVEVGWLGGSTLLESGHGGAFPPSPTADLEPEEPNAAPPSSDPSASSATPTARAVAPRQSPGREDWRDHARAGDYARAYQELHARGGESVRDEAGDLMLAADVARLSAHPQDAVRPLRAVCDRHPNDRSAPVAAFTLGRVLVDDLGRPAEAAAAFRKAYALWPGGPLAEDALAREAFAWDGAGRSKEARAAAQDYLGRYPEGRQAAAMRQILTR
jgi:transmembrane sensor